jgi:hypothetical protein
LRVSKAVKDLGRVLVTELTDMALDVESKARKRDKQEIVREVLEVWARERHKAYRVFARRAAAKGMQLDLAVDDMEDEGLDSKVRK